MRKPKPLATSTKPRTVAKPTYMATAVAFPTKLEEWEWPRSQSAKYKSKSASPGSTVRTNWPSLPVPSAQKSNETVSMSSQKPPGQKSKENGSSQHQPPGKSSKRVRRIMREIGWASMPNTFRTSSCPSPNSLRPWDPGSCLWSSPKNGRDLGPNQPTIKTRVLLWTVPLVLIGHHSWSPWCKSPAKWLPHPVYIQSNTPRTKA